MRAVQNEDKSTTPTYSIKINVQTLGRLNSINHAQDALCFPQSCNYQQHRPKMCLYINGKIEMVPVIFLGDLVSVGKKGHEREVYGQV